MSVWAIVVSWFNAIPAVVWSGIVGATLASGISYFGVRSANKSSLDRLHVQNAHDSLQAQMQREHDARQKEEDRKAAIRREIYIQASEAINDVLATIGGLPLKPMKVAGSGDDETLQIFLKAQAKIWLVADVDAAEKSRELTNLMSELYIKALLLALPLRLAVAPIWDIETQIASEEREIQRTQLRISELKEQLANVEVQAAAARSWRNANEFRNSLLKERQRIIDNTAEQRILYMRDLSKDMSPVQQLIVKLVSALRKEIHLPPNEEAFLAINADMERRAIAALIGVSQGEVSIPL